MIVAAVTVSCGVYDVLVLVLASHLVTQHARMHDTRDLIFFLSLVYVKLYEYFVLTVNFLFASKILKRTLTSYYVVLLAFPLALCPLALARSPVIVLPPACNVWGYNFVF
jgi:hypothetical protein